MEIKTKRDQLSERMPSGYVSSDTRFLVKTIPSIGYKSLKKINDKKLYILVLPLRFEAEAEEGWGT